MSDDAAPDRPTIYTIGHSNLLWPDFIAALQAHDIQIIVDVRSKPRSRFPRFNRAALERALAEDGIGYRFAGDSLGGRPADPSCYRDGVVPEKSADVFRLINYDEVAKRSWYRAGLDELLSLGRISRVAIMCSEGDPLQCHRHHLIARSLLNDADMLHILPRAADGPTAVAASSMASS